MNKYTVDWLEVARRQILQRFRSVLKLDKNFHVYVHGLKSKMELGSDTKGTYLKLYFKQIR